ncbi:MAG: dihydrodipicolinate synthase family protein [Acidimicrobiales bacterium]
MTRPAPRAPLPQGVGVALVTIFDSKGNIDVQATTRHAHRCVDRGIAHILVAGTTGEPWRLSAADRTTLVSAIKKELPDTPTLVGTGDTHAKTALSLTAALVDADVADGIVVLAPTDMPAVSFYAAVREIAPTGLLLAYNLPALSPPGIAPSDMPHLPTDAIKDSSGSADGLAEIIEGGFDIYVGSPNLVALAGRCGARGAILALANTVPEVCIAAYEGDMVAQRRLFGSHCESMVDFPRSLKRDIR